MAVQAQQYPSNVLLFNRSEQERKETDFSQQPPALLDQAPLFFNNGLSNQRKRARDSSSSSAAAAAFQMVPTPQMNLVSSLAQLQQQNHQQVSTGLRLSFEDQNQSQFDLASLINQQKADIDRYLIAQGEELRRTLADNRQRHYRALLAAAEATAARRLREKDIELNRAAQRAAELENRIARLRTESLTWQAKAMSDQATAASLHAQIQQAQLATAAAYKKPEEFGADSSAEDAESAHVDPNRVESCSGWACRVCGVSEVSVVLLPCRHLCMCSACDAAVKDSDAVCCPVCHAVRTGSVQVFLS